MTVGMCFKLAFSPSLQLIKSSLAFVISLSWSELLVKGCLSTTHIILLLLFWPVMLRFGWCHFQILSSPWSQLHSLLNDADIKFDHFYFLICHCSWLARNHIVPKQQTLMMVWCPQAVVCMCSPCLLHGLVQSCACVQV